MNHIHSVITVASVLTIRIVALSFCVHFVFKVEVALSTQKSTCESLFCLMSRLLSSYGMTLGWHEVT